MPSCQFSSSETESRVSGNHLANLNRRPTFQTDRQVRSHISAGLVTHRAVCDIAVGCGATSSHERQCCKHVSTVHGG